MPYLAAFKPNKIKPKSLKNPKLPARRICLLGLNLQTDHQTLTHADEDEHNDEDEDYHMLNHNYHTMNNPWLWIEDWMIDWVISTKINESLGLTWSNQIQMN